MSATSFASGFLGAFLGSRGVVKHLFKLGWYGLLLAIAAGILVVSWWRSLSLGWQALIIVGLLALVTWRLLRMSERPSMVVHEPHELHYLYRWWAPDGTLLYVGLTNDFERRSGEHAKDKPWMVPGVQATVQTFPSRAELVAAERQAIRMENPRHNKIRYS